MPGEATQHAYISYRDAPSALQWLQAIGFRVVTRNDGEDGRVLHAEVRRGDAALMIATADADYVTPPLIGESVGSGVYLCLRDPADVDAWHQRALAAGATPVIAPENTAWGTRRARVLDPEGHEWSAGTYRPGESS
ncbi:VOC family protein [Georgenia ruanii]|uniref:Bleomycin resistance protein n=1 Tax=Georgenia ruanii TaxID=348442 RepID=A0A7J9V0Z6_9MICO|nr:VOC family protein [Georgenia ruanii]MPV90551.1 bleomycin resistance protein [Georgenia ruanii]